MDFKTIVETETECNEYETMQVCKYFRDRHCSYLKIQKNFALVALDQFEVENLKCDNALPKIQIISIKAERCPVITRAPRTCVNGTKFTKKNLNE